MAGLTYRREIDGLRAIAVLAVVLFHADARLMPGGFVGVDIFFVISGYLIGSLLLQEVRETGSIGFAGFYARRLRRLMPAMWVAVLGCIGLSLLVLPRADGSLLDLLNSAVASLLYLSNFYFQGETGGYFDGPAEGKPLLHLWSLAVEEQFYIVFPMILLAAFRWFPHRLSWVMSGLAVASLVLAEYWLANDPGAAFFQMPARFWELAAGVVIATVGFRLSPSRAAVSASLGLALLVMAIAASPAGGHFPGLGAIPAVAGTVLVLCAIHGSEDIGWSGKMLGLRPMVFVGLCSYSLYLWHWPLLALDTATSLDPSPLAMRLGLCAGAMGLAWLSLRFVEQPWRKRGLAVMPVFKATGMATALLLIFALGLARLPLSDEVRAQLAARSAADQPAAVHSGCHHSASKIVERLAPRDCNSVPGVTPKVVLWGDSHAIAWQPFAHELGSTASHTMDACPPMQGFRGERSDFPSHGENCRRLNDLVLDMLDKGDTDTLVIAARWPIHFGSAMMSQPEKARLAQTRVRPAAPEDVGVGLRAAIARVAPKVRRIIVLGPIPVLRHEAPKCIALGRLPQCVLTRGEFEEMASGSWRRLLEATSGFDNVELADPMDFFCGKQECLVIRDGYSLYWDDDHVSSTAARAFSLDWAQGRHRRHVPGMTTGRYMTASGGQ